jgi:hypothetical protein
MTVTWRRSAPEETVSGGDRTDGCSAGAARFAPCSPELVSDAPQSPQNFFPAGLSAPHAGHRCGSGVPQRSQKILPSWIAAWHCGHCMLGPALITFFSILPYPDCHQGHQLVGMWNGQQRCRHRDINLGRCHGRLFSSLPTYSLIKPERFSGEAESASLAELAKLAF